MGQTLLTMYNNKIVGIQQETSAADRVILLDSPMYKSVSQKLFLTPFDQKVPRVQFKLS